MNQLIEASYGEGLNMHFHVVGDAGIDVTLDALEKAIAKHGRKGLRSNLTHAFFIDPVDMARMQAVDAGVSTSTIWVMQSPSHQLFDDVLGKPRAENFYQLGSLAGMGVKVGFASDYPVAATFPSFRPLDQIEMAITRRPPGKPESQSLPQMSDALSVAQAVRAATIDNAWLLNQEKTIGSIAAGKSADFVVLGRNLFDVPVHEIHAIPVLETWYRGRKVYVKED